MAKDKFKKMQQGGGAGSFQETLVQAATTVAAIEMQNTDMEPSVGNPIPHIPGHIKTDRTVPAQKPSLGVESAAAPRFMRLPNPQIPLQEYNLVSNYCGQFANMTRQDFVELAIIEKLHSDGGMPQEEFNRRYEEIRNRPPRGQRKGMKNSTQSN
jgi:hypothetical protein